MTKAKMIVLVAAPEGQSAGLDQWYENRHVPDLLAVPGIKAVERFDIGVVLHAPEGAPRWDFVGVYDLEADDIGTVLKEMGSRMGTARMPTSATLDSDKTLAVIAYPKTRK